MAAPVISCRAVNEQAAAKLRAAGMSPLWARLLAARGVVDAAAAALTLDLLPHFESLKNIKAMAAAISDAVTAGSKIVIAADYDADGATACALALRFFRQINVRAGFVVPHRQKDGYGLSPALVKQAEEQGARVIITVDNGIAANAAVACARSKDITVLVTDHHLPAEILPDCLIVNPNQPGCLFPSKNLAGVGVIFYVLAAVRHELDCRGYFGGNLPLPNMAALLDLVALGTVADVVPLDHTNRILVYQGLQRLRCGQGKAGIKTLLKTAKRSASTLSTMDLGFAVGPRLNAAGRLDDMSIGIRCLTVDDETEAAALANRLDELNRQRRATEQDMLAVTEDDLPPPDLKEQYGLSIYKESFHPGVIGIVAGKLKEKYYRPTVVFAAAGNGEIRGSARSIPQFHIRDALDRLSKQYPQLIKQFGGHAMAAGLTLAAVDFSLFKKVFNELARQSLPPELLHKIYRTDGSLSIAEINAATARELEAGIWGQGFACPLFHDDFTVVAQKKVGSRQNHLKLLVKKDGQLFDAVIFSCTATLPAAVTLVYRLTADNWRGRERVQLQVDYWQEKLA